LAVKSILLGVAVALVAGTAFAADMPVKAPPMAPPPPTWTGTYVGVNGGYGWGTSNQTDVLGATSGSYNINGGVAGVTYGGNWQAGHVVLGFETDFDWAHINGNKATAVCAATNCFTNTKWLSTERMRAGWDFDGWLVYGTVGAAFADVKAGQDSCGGGLCGEKSRGGWTAGVGVETMFWRNWSAKLEYLHYDLGKDIMYNPGTAVAVLDRGDIVRAGINYHFDMMNLLGLFH
jgi:outer membrane immunogenic protein